MTARSTPLLLTLLLVGCGSESTTSEGTPTTDSGSVSADSSAAPSCTEVCTVVSATKCSTDAAVQDLAACTAECETWRAKSAGCTEQWNALLRCCATRGVAVECTDPAIEFGDCDDACKLEGERYGDCYTSVDAGEGG